MATEKILELNAVLKVHNRLWNASYRITKDRHFYKNGQFICRLDDLDKTLVGDGEVILAFNDGTRLAINSQGFRWVKREVAANG